MSGPTIYTYVPMPFEGNEDFIRNFHRDVLAHPEAELINICITNVNSKEVVGFIVLADANGCTLKELAQAWIDKYSIDDVDLAQWAPA